MLRTRKITILGILIGLGLVLSMVENMIPMSFIVPGAKLGLANIVNLMGLIFLGFFGGFQILIMRILLSSLLIGTFLTIPFYLSVSGGFLGYFMMALFYNYFEDKFSLLGISIIGAVFHNIGQIVTAYFLIKTTGIFYYLPYLTLIAVPTGIGVGLVTFFTLNYLPSGFK